MNNHKKIEEYFKIFNLEVHDSQENDPSVGIRDGYVAYCNKSEEYYIIAWDDALYWTMNNGGSEDIFKDSELDKEYYA